MHCLRTPPGGGEGSGGVGWAGVGVRGSHHQQDGENAGVQVEADCVRRPELPSDVSCPYTHTSCSHVSDEVSVCVYIYTYIHTCIYTLAVNSLDTVN